MGYTNKTSHYELPQYVANDKPSWLGDFNAAMLKIDTVMADNDATAEAANSAATGAQTQVAALSSQLSTIQGQVNTAVDTATTADGKATTAQSVATQASTTASEAKTLAETAKQSADLALPIGGGTMSGDLILNGAPTANNQAATKAYVDANSGNAGDDAMVSVAGRSTNTSTNNWLVIKNNFWMYISFQVMTKTTLTSSATADLTSFYDLGRITGNVFGLAQHVDGQGDFTEIGVLMNSDNRQLTLSAYYDGSDTRIGFVWATATAQAQLGGKLLWCNALKTIKA